MNLLGPPANTPRPARATRPWACESGGARIRSSRAPARSMPRGRRSPRKSAFMAIITFIQPDGTEQVVDAQNGMTVMEEAKKNMVEGIEAECGGACACATCHVFVDEAWFERTGGPSEMEEDMLDFAFDVRPTSRLSCQIKVTDALDGLVLRVPEKQF